MTDEFPLRPDGTIDALALLRESTPLLSDGVLPPTAEELREQDELDARQSRRVWAAMMLTDDVLVFDSILRGDLVPASKLDRVVLSRGLRGQPLPAAHKYVVIDNGVLDAIAEAGVLE